MVRVISFLNKWNTGKVHYAPRSIVCWYCPFFECACQPSERLSALMAKQLIRAYNVSGQVVRCDLVQGVYRALFLSFY